LAIRVSDWEPLRYYRRPTFEHSESDFLPFLSLAHLSRSEYSRMDTLAIRLARRHSFLPNPPVELARSDFHRTMRETLESLVRLYPELISLRIVLAGFCLNFGDPYTASMALTELEKNPALDRERKNAVHHILKRLVRSRRQWNVPTQPRAGARFAPHPPPEPAPKTRIQRMIKRFGDWKKKVPVLGRRRLPSPGIIYDHMVPAPHHRPVQNSVQLYHLKLPWQTPAIFAPQKDLAVGLPNFVALTQIKTSLTIGGQNIVSVRADRICDLVVEQWGLIGSTALDAFQSILIAILRDPKDPKEPLTQGLGPLPFARCKFIATYTEFSIIAICPRQFWDQLVECVL